MPTQEGELRSGLVVEGLPDVSPPFGGVATVAIGPLLGLLVEELSSVEVLVAVAALVVDGSETAPLMAVRAVDLGVFALAREAGLGVIERVDRER